MSSLVRSAASTDSLAQTREVHESRIPVVTEAELADRLRRDGRHVIRHRGRSWTEAKPGFYRPVHPCARLSAREATWPTVACWGYQACLDEPDATHATGAFPVHVVRDLDQFSEDRLPASRRYKLRKARRQVRMVELTGPALLREQGYEVLLSARTRTRYGAVPTREEYLAGLRRFGDPARGIVLAGLIDGQLAGYIVGWAVDGIAYVGDVMIRTEAMSTPISTGLTLELIYACQRSGGIVELVHGMHAREDEGLCRYKDWLGLPVVRLPAKVRMLPGIGPLIRHRKPHAYYRLTGR
jgi:hypothetical protein